MLDLSVGDRVAFVYATKAGPKQQIGVVLPSSIDDTTSPVFGICRTKQASQGTGRKQEQFIRITTSWGRGFGTFNLPKIMGTIVKVL